MIKFSIKKIIGSITCLFCACTVANAMLPDYPVTFQNSTTSQCMGFTVSVPPDQQTTSGIINGNQTMIIDYTNSALYSVGVTIFQKSEECASQSNWTTTANFNIDIGNHVLTPGSCAGTACTAIKGSATSDKGFQFILWNS